MKNIRRIYNWLLVHAFIDGLRLLSDVFDWLSRKAYVLSDKAHSLFWEPVGR